MERGTLFFVAFGLCVLCVVSGIELLPQQSRHERERAVYYLRMQAAPIINNSNIYGPGSFNATAGVPTYAIIRIADGSNNTIPCNSSQLSQLSVNLTSTNNLIPATNITPSCNSDGSWNAAYTTNVADVYRLDVSYLGEILPDSPAWPTVGPAAVSPAQSVAYGQALVKAEVSPALFFTIQAKDQFGNSVAGCGAQWTVAATANGQNVNAGITSCFSEMGQYSGFYNASTAGTYLITVTGGSTALPGSPFNVTITA